MSRVVERSRSRRRATNKRLATGIAELYPTPSATTKVYPRLGSTGFIPAEDNEPRAILCAQCGQPIEDTGVITLCPFCRSDNFKGRTFKNV